MKMKFTGALLLLLFTQAAEAQNTVSDSAAEARFTLHFQTTYIHQYKPPFHSTYSGINSLVAGKETENSLTATLFAGARLWKGATVYINPELAGGSGLSGALGMGGSTNGETFRVGNPSPTLYLARGFFKQTVALTDKYQKTDDDENQVAMQEPEKYIRFYIGKYSLGDLFDNNQYSNTPRSQFLNWGLMNDGAWDYAANVRGYTYAFTTELKLKTVDFKVAIASLPKSANGAELNTKITESYALNAQVEKSYTLKNLPGNISVLGFLNRAAMGNYALATAAAVAAADTPNVIATRMNGRTKAGFSINWEQQISKYAGLFARAGWNDGKNETWAFTEIDNSISLGISVAGGQWKRPDDNFGFALLSDGLSASHRAYLAKGGYGFILGDGKLNYAREMIGELYYSVKPGKMNMWLTGDYQLALNPGYNKDRGPANIFSIRLHVTI